MLQSSGTRPVAPETVELDSRPLPITPAADCSIPSRSVNEGQFRRSLTYRLVAFNEVVVKQAQYDGLPNPSMGNSTDLEVRRTIKATSRYVSG